MKENRRKMGTFVVKNNIFIGEKEVVFGVDELRDEPFMVCDCFYETDKPEPMIKDFFSTADYLEAMQEYTERIQQQITLMRMEHEEFEIGMKPLTIDDCIYAYRDMDINGKVVALKPDQYEYRHSAYQLILVNGGLGALPEKDRAFFNALMGCQNYEIIGTRLIDGKEGVWQRYNVMGEIKPGRIPAWAKKALSKIKKKQREDWREER